MLMMLAGFGLQARNERDTLGLGSRMTFSENLGQWDSHILFRSQMKAASLFLEKDCFTIVVQHPENELHHPAHAHMSDRYRTHAYRVRFLGAITDTLVGGMKQDDHENYFIGNDRSRWKSNVSVYQAVSYQNIYNGIDLKVYSASNAMKYDFVLQPGSDPSQIAMRYEGVEGTRLKDGNVIVRTSVLDIVELKPYAYQIIDGKEHEVAAAYILKDNEVRFQLGEYDHSQELVIDPYLYFSTYTGSTADNWGTTACYDMYKRTYSAGMVFGNGYPSSLGAYDGSFNGDADVGIFVFSEDGSQRIYATYLGGTYGDMPHSMFVNDLNELVIFGTTGSPNFPTTPNAYDTSFNGGTPITYDASAIHYPQGSDIFVSRFNSTGTELAASTFVGGSGNDGLNYKQYYNNSIATVLQGNDSLYFNYGDGARGELITDNLSNIYVGSTTQSADFPTTPNCFNTTYSGGQDGIVFKIDYNLQNILWSGYLGGTGDDAIYSIDVDDSYNLLVCGGTTSRDIPTTAGAYHTRYRGGTTDGFVAKIAYHGATLMGCTYFGSPDHDQCYFVRCGKQNDVFLFGQTKSYSNLIINATYGTTNGGQFLARLQPDLKGIVWSTQFGSGRGEPDISPTAFAADICDRVYAVGWGRKFGGYYLNGTTIPWSTYGTTGLPTTPDAYQDTTDGQDFYIFSMDANATQQIYGSFFGELHSSSLDYGGNDHVDGGTSRFDRCATLYQAVCASCQSTNGFPTSASAWSNDNNSSNCNNAVFRFNVSSDFPVADFCQPPAMCAPVNGYTFVFNGRADSVRWDYGDGTSDNGFNSQHYGRHSYSTPGLYTIRLIAYMDNGCRATDTMEHQMLVVGNNTYWLDTIRTCAQTAMQIGTMPTLNASYLWTQGQVSDSTVANPYITQPGSYTMLITTTSGASTCVDTVHQVALIGQAAFTLVGDTVGCSSPMQFSALSQGSGLTFQWSRWSDLRDTLNADPTSPTLLLDLDTSLSLYLHAVDELGCEKLDSIRVRYYHVLDSLATTGISCPGLCDGTATVIPTSNAIQPYSFSFDSGPMSGDSLRTGLCGGTHSVVFTDGAGCRVSRQFSLSEPAPPFFVPMISHIHCDQDHSGSISLGIQGFRPPYTISWSNGETGPLISGLTAGDYTATVTDSSGCLFTRTYTVNDWLHSFDSLRTWADDEVVFVNMTTRLHAEGADNCTYYWMPDDLVDNPASAHPTATIRDTTVFYVTVTDSVGCTTLDSVRVDCILFDCGKSSIFIPNAFTPNGDGLNDQLCFRNQWVREFEIRIFSRWGEMVYQSSDYNQCWDGTYNGKMCQPGVYTYYCKIVCEAEQEATFKGDITLIR